jgi:hypothetical protein
MLGDATKCQPDPKVGLRIMTIAVKLDSCTFYIKIWIWPCLDRIICLRYSKNEEAMSKEILIVDENSKKVEVCLIQLTINGTQPDFIWTQSSK